jgi:hypothetical protein
VDEALQVNFRLIETRRIGYNVTAGVAFNANGCAYMLVSRKEEGKRKEEEQWTNKYNERPS